MLPSDIPSILPDRDRGCNSRLAVPGSYSVTVNGMSGSQLTTTSVILNVLPVSNVSVNIDTLVNRHAISPHINGGNPSQEPARATDIGSKFTRFGGNAASTYNWQLHTYNSGADYFFEDFQWTDSSGNPLDSAQMITNYQNAGSSVITTIPMLNWVAQSPDNGTNDHWSFSIASFGAQCSHDQYNTDAGNGLQTDCLAPVTTNAVTNVYFPLLDTTSQPCPSGNCDYRQPWVQALAQAFGTSGWCPVPPSQITSCHFYDMDNEIDIWSGSHRDVHPAPSGYDELVNVYESEADNVKKRDPAAVRFGRVLCCWWFYWNDGPSGDNKSTHAGVDFLPWWLNHVYWMDQINGARSLDVFDVHAYPTPSTSGLTTVQIQALAATAYRDYWDPTYLSTGIQSNAPSMQTNPSIPFRIPRMTALVNAIYPGTPLSFTEWSAALISESDFSTALGDANALGVMRRVGVSFASRWLTPANTNPNYYAFKLCENYDGN